jgi:hypothetical protein
LARFKDENSKLNVHVEHLTKELEDLISDLNNIRASREEHGITLAEST